MWLISRDISSDLQLIDPKQSIVHTNYKSNEQAK